MLLGPAVAAPPLEMPLAIPARRPTWKRSCPAPGTTRRMAAASSSSTAMPSTTSTARAAGARCSSCPARFSATWAAARLRRGGPRAACSSSTPRRPGWPGGAGTYVFLAGLGFFEGDTFVVRQLFLPDLESERALLHLFNDLLGRSAAWSASTARAFDWPLIESRFTLSRMRPARASHLHLDLLAAGPPRLEGLAALVRAGRRWKRTSLRLRRHGDVPGWLIPSLYFEYLRAGGIQALLAGVRAQPARRAVAAGAGRAPGRPAARARRRRPAGAECYGLGRFYEDLGNYEASVRCYERALTGALSPALRATTLQRADRRAQEAEPAPGSAAHLGRADRPRDDTRLPLRRACQALRAPHPRVRGGRRAGGPRAHPVPRPWVRAAAPRNTVPELDRRRARLTKKLARDAAR